MIQRLTCGLAVKTENQIRGVANPFVRSSIVKKERSGVVRYLDAARFVRPSFPVAVTLTRISPGYLDDDGLRGSLKAVRDGVADWLGLDDRDARVSWRYLQQGCRLKERGLTIELQDDADGVDEIVVTAEAPMNLGAAVESTHLRRAADVPKDGPQQLRLQTLPTFVRLPWDAGRIHRMPLGGDPPEEIAIVIPAAALSTEWGAGRLAGTTVKLHRRKRKRSGGDEVFCYEERRRPS